MQKFLRVAIIILLALVTLAIIFSQTRLYAQRHAALQSAAKIETQSPLNQLPPSQVMLTQGAMSPADIARETAEHEKDREVLRAIEHDTAKLAASSLAQNYLMLFQAIIYFLILVIIYSLLENVKKFAHAASQSAEAARISAEAASKASDGGHGKSRKRQDFNKFIMRRLRGNYVKR